MQTHTHQGLWSFLYELSARKRGIAMQSNILQDFLRLRLLDIGAEDTRLEKLGSACEELAQRYAVKPSAALTPLLAAWDPTAGEDPALLAVGQVVQNHWPTYRGAFQSEPLTLYRAIILEAIMRAMERQGTLAVAVHLLGANILPYLKVGREQEPLSKLLDRAKAISSTRLAEQWPAQSEAAPVAPFQMPEIPGLEEIDADTWLAQVAAAAGPNTNKPDVALTDPNPQWPNSATNWAYAFADRMAHILADVHDKAATAATSVNAQALKALGEAVSTKLNQLLTTESARATQLRTSSRLIWWRQALYSETAARPYRKLAPHLIALHMALDLAELLPEVYPPAVESLLYEAVRAATGPKCVEELSLNELLEAQWQSPQLASISTMQKRRTTPVSRPLFIQALANSCASGKSELPQLGVAPDTKLELGDWAIWLLREVKALDAVSSPDEIAIKKEPA